MSLPCPSGEAGCGLLAEQSQGTPRSIRHQRHDRGHERRRNFSTDDGWILNSSTMAITASWCQGGYANMHVQEQDEYDLNKMYDILLKEILPLYYDKYDTLETDRQEWHAGCPLPVRRLADGA